MVKSYLPREQRIKTAGPDVKVLRATSGPERIVKAGTPQGTPALLTMVGILAETIKGRDERGEYTTGPDPW